MGGAILEIKQDTELKGLHKKGFRVANNKRIDFKCNARIQCFGYAAR